MGEAVLFLWVEKCREFLLEGVGEEEELKEEGVGGDEEVVIPVAVRSEEVQCPDILTGPTLEDRRSVFQGHVATVVDSSQVNWPPHHLATSSPGHLITWSPHHLATSSPGHLIT